MNENENKDLQVTTTEVIANEEAVTEMETTVEEEASTKKSPGEFWAKATVFGKKVADNVQKNAVALSEKAKADSYQRRMEKYNPLFIKEYKSKNFIMPTLIQLVDDAAVQEIDVCAGAIGWREKSNDVEILFLSMDFAAKSGLDFFPALVSNSLFCAETYNESQYINVERIFGKAHEEKLAELEHIAHSLGAKSCSIELVESDDVTDSKSRDGQASMKVLKASAKERTKNASSHSMSGRTVSTFAGSSSPIRPTLKWFKKDHNILNLIEMRCSDVNAIQSRTLILEGSSSMTMEQSQARNIDIATAKIGMKLHSSMEKLHRKEYSSKLIYEVEF